MNSKEAQLQWVRIGVTSWKRRFKKREGKANVLSVITVISVPSGPPGPCVQCFTWEAALVIKGRSMRYLAC